MKRTLSTVAIAAVAALGSTAALAQSSVTVYGRLNVTVERQKAGDETNKGIFNNASRIGFKGTEDLGGGLKAGFQLEHGFNVDTGAQSQTDFWARQSEVNLGGPFGMIRLGRMTSEAYYATADYVSMHNHDTGSSSDALYAYVSENRDKVSYRTPSLGGFTFEAAATARDTANEPNRTYDAAANYTMGPLQLGAGYAKNGDAKQFGVRALYDFGSFILGGYVQRDKNAWLGDDSGSRTNFRISGAYLLGASEFHVNVGRSGDIGDFDNTSALQWTLAYNYNLSKRTKVYTYYTRISGDGAGIYSGAPGDGKFSSIAFGLRHNF